MNNKKIPITTDDLKLSVKNMGNIKQGELVQKPLTVFCGPNNTGKTWVMYALSMFYEVRRKREKLRKKGHRIEELSINEISEIINDNLYNYFNVPEEIFAKTELNFDISGQQYLELGKDEQQPKVFLMPAERNGLHLFYRELSIKRTTLLHHASKPHIDINKLLHDVMKSRYAQPIADYIDWLNELTEQTQTGGDFREEAMLLQKELVQGRYSLNRKTGDVSYQPYKKHGITPNTLGLHTASSVAKSLFGLWFYLQYQAKKGDILMIDEPELNIHPDNQLKIAHLLARLVNTGLRVVISTHSDYIVREFNSLTMLSEDKNKQIKHPYQENEILKPERVGIYLFDKNTITPSEYKNGEGFVVSTFDTAINKQNSNNDNIYYGLKDYED